MVNKILEYNLIICIEDKTFKNMKNKDITKDLPDYIHKLINKFLDNIPAENQETTTFYKEKNSKKKYNINTIKIKLDEWRNGSWEASYNWDIKEHIDLRF